MCVFVCACVCVRVYTHTYVCNTYIHTYVYSLSLSLSLSHTHTHTNIQVNVANMSQWEKDAWLRDLCSSMPDDAILPEDHARQIHASVFHGAQVCV